MVRMQPGQQPQPDKSQHDDIDYVDSNEPEPESKIKLQLFIILIVGLILAGIAVVLISKFV